MKNTSKLLNVDRIDVHAALAHAHADRAAYVRLAFAGVPALLKRLVARLRPNRQRAPQSGAWA
jgi:hypothetical protein